MGTTATPPPYGGNSFATQPGGNESAFSNEACAVPGANAGMVPAYTASYTYDDAGNRLTKNDTRLGNFGYAYDEENRLTTETFDHPPADNVVDETFTYTFDKNGNTLTRNIGGGTVHNYSYDYANRLKSYVKTANAVPTSSFTYTYAPSGERVLKTNQLAGSTTAFMYDGSDVVTDYSVPMAGTYTTIKSYVQGLGIDSKFAEIDAFGATLFYDNDALGTVHQVVDTPPLNQDAQVVNRQLTTAWGEDLLQPSQVTRYGFTHRERDEESDLMYYRARHYSPRLGRFWQNVTVGHYRYLTDNPINGTDPFGLDEPKEGETEVLPSPVHLSPKSPPLQFHVPMPPGVPLTYHFYQLRDKGVRAKDTKSIQGALDILASYNLHYRLVQGFDLKNASDRGENGRHVRWEEIVHPTTLANERASTTITGLRDYATMDDFTLATHPSPVNPQMWIVRKLNGYDPVPGHIAAGGVTNVVGGSAFVIEGGIVVQTKTVHELMHVMGLTDPEILQFGQSGVQATKGLLDAKEQFDAGTKNDKTNKANILFEKMKANYNARYDMVVRTWQQERQKEDPGTGRLRPDKNTAPSSSSK